MPVITVRHNVTTVNLSIVNLIDLPPNGIPQKNVVVLFFQDAFVFFNLLNWVALVFPRLGLSFDAVSFSLVSERKKPNKEEHKEDGKANYRRTRPFAFDEVD